MHPQLEHPADDGRRRGSLVRGGPPELKPYLDTLAMNLMVPPVQSPQLPLFDQNLPTMIDEVTYKQKTPAEALADLAAKVADGVEQFQEAHPDWEGEYKPAAGMCYNAWGAPSLRSPRTARRASSRAGGLGGRDGDRVRRLPGPPPLARPSVRRIAGGACGEVSPPCRGSLFISPWIIGFAWFQLYPILASIRYSFTNYNMMQPPVWIGLDNYTRLFTEDELFRKALTNTAIYACSASPSI